MNKEQKAAAVEEIGAELEASQAVFAVNYRGISVTQVSELRGALREADASFTVVKNRLAKRVTAEKGAEALDEHLVGPTALTYVKGDPVVAAKAITAFIKEHETIVYKGGIMEGSALDADQFQAIAKLPGREVLYGQLVGLTASPLTGLVTGLNGLIQGLATQLGKIAEGGMVPAEGAAPAEAPEAPAEEAPAEEAAAEDAAEAPEAEAEAPAAEETEEAPAAEADAPADEETTSEEAENDVAPEASADADEGEETKED